MLEQHPVPQNVTTFQFRLIGDMTIKQFGYLAGGIILGYIAYKLPLPFFFTWPLAALFGFGGIGFAFVPIEQRPMDVWFLSFIKSIYSPTLYIWQREKPRESAQSVPTVTTTAVPSLFSLFSFPGNKTKTPVGENPIHSQKTTTSSFKMPSFNLSFSVPKKKISLPPKSNVITHPAMASSVLASTPIPTVKESPTTNVSPQPIQQTPQVPPEDNKIKDLEKKLEESLSERKRMEEELQSIKQMLLAQQGKQFPPAPVQVIEQKTIPPPPALPFGSGRANVIEGLVRQNTGELINSILVTVKDKDDIPLRALKTNKVGQFASSTPLPNGIYTIDVEDPKNIFFFNPISVTLSGTIVPPLIVIAKTKQEIERMKLEEALFGKKND